MVYIPKEHEKYDVLPICRREGGEVFEYPSELIHEVEKLIGSSPDIFPYNYESYEEYFAAIDNLISAHKADSFLVSKLKELRETVRRMNQKEEWSILRYVGPSDGSLTGITHGKTYYWPTRKDNPVYCGVVDDEEFTAYLYPTEPHLWVILEDPTGMAYRTIYEKGTGYLSQASHDDFMEQIHRQFGGND